jgi:hypothetical protein
MTSEIEACLWIRRIKRNLGSIRNIANCAEQTHTTSKVICFSVEIKCLLDHPLRLEVLRPPFKQLRLPLSTDKLLQALNHIELSQHAWHLSFVGSTFNIVFDRHVNVTDPFKMLCHHVMSVLKIDSVVLLSDFNSFVPLIARHVQLAKQVVTTTFFVQLFCIIDHV